MASSQVSTALDAMFERPEGLYGSFQDIPVIAQAGHARRMELLERLDIGDVSRRTVVDFGMGSWGFAAVYPKLHNCARAIGMDVSNAALKISRDLVASSQPAYASRFETMQSDGMHLPLAAGSVDVFFSGESIEHVKFPPRYLSEIHRVLRPGGQLIVTTPNRDAIRYKEAGEEYCTSPEHFWLFNTQELVEAISEFFYIKEIYGFNGSFGSHEEDREIVDQAQADAWSREFEHAPEHATGIVLRAVPKPHVARSYWLTDIQPPGIAITGADTYLPLEFGLQGLLLDNANASVTLTRPPGSGIVCRFWSHRWSGKVRITTKNTSQEQDLYTKVPGWRNWIARNPTTEPTTITITPTLEHNARSEASQVIFFEAFSYDLEEGSETAAVALQTADQLPTPQQSLQVPGYAFARYQRTVSTTVFHWFSANEGNVRGPWQPIGGRRAWDGSVRFWRGQIQEIMLANIDAVYLHLIPLFEDNRITFFKAYAELRAEGWDVPKVAPFLDPFAIWREASIDLATKGGKDTFVAHYIRFFQQYLAENTDPAAPTYLLTIDGRLALSTWWVSLLKNVQQLERGEVESRLRAALGDRIPQLQAGIWAITTALVDPDLAFSDERAVMFSGYAYAIHSVHNGIDVWHVQPGYWDQNIRRPGYFLPRDGGKPYRRAWDIIAATLPHVGRVYVESWNEYDEGSGIYSADPDGLFVDAAMHTNRDTFSDDDNPYEYVLTTANGAARVNDRPQLDARFIWHDTPRRDAAGRVTLNLVVRNEGNRRWTTPEQFGIYLLSGHRTVGFVPIDDGCGNAPAPQRGIMRGQPVAFMLCVMAEPATRELTLTMGHGGSRFGERLSIALHEPGQRPAAAPSMLPSRPATPRGPATSPAPQAGLWSKLATAIGLPRRG